MFNPKAWLKVVKAWFAPKQPLYTIRYRWKPSHELPAFLWDGKESSREALVNFMGDKHTHIANDDGSFTFIHPNQLLTPKNTFVWAVGAVFYMGGTVHVYRNYVVEKVNV